LELFGLVIRHAVASQGGALQVIFTDGTSLGVRPSNARGWPLPGFLSPEFSE